MKKLREVLRLKFECELKNRQISRSLQISASTVSYYSRAAIAAKLSWPLDESMSDSELITILEPYCTQLQIRPKDKAGIDVRELHQELKRKGVTLELLWKEYQHRFGKRAYSYSEFCRQYRTWRKQQKPSMRQCHKAGEKAFIDYAGPTVTLTEPESGNTVEAVIFVGVLGASNYTFAKAYRSRQLPDWIQAHQDMLVYFGGVPELLIPDNEKSGVTRACYYDPDLNPQYSAFAAHYGTAILPTRPGKPQDKAKVEVAVQIVERWILARLRHLKFFSLAALNQAIEALLDELNHKPFKKLPGTRASQHEAIDKPALSPLPTLPYEYTAIKSLQVRLDYHLEVDNHYYSVPYHLMGKTVEYRQTSQLVEIYYQHVRVASHQRSSQVGGSTTVIAHMPKAHQKHQQFSPQTFLQWAQEIGASTYQVAHHLIQQQPHPECCYRSYLGFRKLAKTYTSLRLESACHYAMTHQTLRYNSLKSILVSQLDLQHPLPESANDIDLHDEQESHCYVRGAHYYHQQPSIGE